MLKDIRIAITELLQADDYYANIPVLREDLKDIDSEIQQALNQLGICILVLTIGAGDSGGVHRQAQADQIYPVIQVYENPKLNDTGLGASDVAEHSAALIKAQEGWLTDTVPIDLNDGLWLQLVPSNDAVIYQVYCRASAVMDATIRQVETPVIDETDGVITFTCGTKPAALYYTLDGTAPTPANGTFYEGPFAPDAGLQLLVRGWAAGWLASETVELAETAGGGTVPPMITLADIVEALNSGGGKFQLTAAGDPVIKGEDNQYHDIQVSTPGDSVVAGDGRATIDEP